MGRKFFNNIIQKFVSTDLLVSLILVFIIMLCNIWLGVACLVIIGFQLYMHRKNYSKLEGKLRNLTDEIQSSSKDVASVMSERSPMLICVSDSDCVVSYGNRTFREIFPEDEDFRRLVGKNFVRKFFTEEENYTENIVIKENSYSVSSASVGKVEENRRAFFFNNVSLQENYKKLYDENRLVFAVVNVDNYDELLGSSSAVNKSAIIADIDSRILDFAKAVNGSSVKTSGSRYIIVFGEGEMESLKKNNFQVLEEVHKIQTEADFPTTISIGVGGGEQALSVSRDLAESALELALGRGGDQAVVMMKGCDPEYFGGALTTVENRSKGKSRIVAHALGKLIGDADQVFVMGHKKPDMDSLGAAIGISALVRGYDVPVYIVLSEAGEGIDLMLEAAKASGLYTFINGEEAEGRMTSNSLLIIVDVAIAPITDSPQLLEKTEKRVVIDHHRKSASSIKSATINLTETYASSASELVSELLQFSADISPLSKNDADCLLAGISLDSKSFTSNAGVRTFEAASWLRRNGADNATVQNFFRIELDFYKKKTNIIASAEILENGLAVAYTSATDPDMQILVAQAANELLEMRGVKAAIAAGRSIEKTVVSARSDGQINVQVLMEKLGGGGHVNVAAAQVETGPEETIQQIVQMMREETL